jgi:hypothetical protein
MAMHLDWRYFIGPGILRSRGLPGWGVSLPVAYCLWIGFVLILYLPCRWFSGVKARRRDWWLSYL